MLLDESYEVRTHWGWFRLDRGAYKDYLAGKLWITWIPGKSKEQAAEQQKEDILPPNVTDAAIRLRDMASRHGAYVTFQSAFPGVAVEIPFKQRMKDKPIDELALSVRSSNGLMRANAGTFGRLWELLSRETGIRSVRNLGAKSEAEILRCFFDGCYLSLSSGEQATYWQLMLNRNGTHLTVDKGETNIGIVYSI